jgi:glycogen debranching enzyme
MKTTFEVLVAASLLIAQPDIGAAQLAVPQFPIASSPIELRGDVRPHQYLGVIGRAAAWLGKETGEAELWVHPLKLGTDFLLDFKIPDYVEPVRGRDVARTVVVRPELTTIVYSHATFTVRQHILAPVKEPGLIVLLDVQTFRPLEIIVSFKSVLQYAWPGSLGGQYTFWDADERAFIQSESLRQHNGVIGSPWASTASAHPAHAQPDVPSSFVIPVDTARAANEFIPIAVTAAMAPRDTVLGRYRALIANAARLYEDKRAHVTKLLDETTSIDSPNDSLDLAFQWAKVNLAEQFTCNPDLGCGLVAGWGPSGSSARPGFGWFFGGDAAINSFAMDATGLWEEVAAGLRFLAEYQDQRGGVNDGKIPHEISQSAAHIPWFTDFPYTYYHADTTPYWIVAAWRYWRASGDNGWLAAHWPNVQRAYAWCLTTETDGDGIIENTTGGLGAIELGALGEGIHQDIYLAAVWIKALEAVTEMGWHMGDDQLAMEAESIRDRASSTLNDGYWREEDGHHAFGILQSGQTNDNLTVWPATAAAFALLDAPRAESTLTKLAADSISADWGARILSTGSPLYDPMHYNNGAVWPFVTGFVSWGQYSYRRPWAGFPLVDAVAQLTFDWSRGRHPELMSGRYYRPLDAAVPQQFFATSMLVTPLMAGLVGWDPDAPQGRATLAPQLPPRWDRFTASGLRVGDTRIAAAFEQRPGEFAATIAGSGPNVTVTLVLPVPLGARDVQLDAGAEYGPASLQQGPHDGWMNVDLPIANDSATVSVRWEGGLAVEPPTVALQPGQQSDGVRVLDFRFGDDVWLLTVEGAPGRTYDMTLYGEEIHDIDGAEVLERNGGQNWIRVAFSSGDRRVTRVVRIAR